jgi:aspartate carbamoyltransferase catalytic subunit
MKRDLITVNDLTVPETLALFEAAQEYELMLPAERLRLRDLQAARQCLLMFYEPSTRTRISFQVAAHAFGMSTCVADAVGTSVVKGESLTDTAQTFGAMGFDLAVFRHPEDGAAAQFAREFACPVVNGGDGCDSHPTQALLDCYTLWKRKLLKEGLQIGICGDVLHSRVARSNARLLNRFSITPHFIGPPALLVNAPAGEGSKMGFLASLHTELDPLLPELDVLIMLRTQFERHGGQELVARDEFAAGYQLNHRRLQRLKPKAVIMHPGPVNRGIELADEAMADQRSAILEQVANGVFVRMALIALLVTPEEAL